MNNESIDIKALKEKISKKSNSELETLIKSLGFEQSVNMFTRPIINSKLNSMTDAELIKLADEYKVDLTKL